MLTKEILEKTKHCPGELTAQQEEILNEYLDQGPDEPELQKKLGAAEEKMTGFLKAVRSRDIQPERL